jgi:HlyD family secretion protein
MKSRLIRWGVWMVILGGLLAGAFVWHSSDSKAADVSLRLTPVKRGDLVSTISATGTVEPEEVVDVGAQVAGQIRSFGKDRRGKTIDYGSAVEVGTVLARIDPSLYEADLEQAKAQLVQAKANVQKAEADLGQLHAKLAQAEADWKRAQELGPSDALAQSAYDAYKADYESAKANIAVGEATVAQAKGAELQAEGVVARAQRNLGYCTIISPVRGVIIDRRVNIGQTVVASLNAPSLFLIAKDLRRMQVWVPVNEADIANIHPGQPVTFTVDARPGETFTGKVEKIRLNAAMTQNVVTYTVEVATNNSNGKLLPYLTANVSFQVERHPDVLMVPNAALRWTPTPDEISPSYRETNGAGSNGAATSGSSRRQGQRSSGAQGIATASPQPHAFGTLWVKTGDGVRPIPVRTGLTDGIMTEVRSPQLREGLEVVSGIQMPQMASDSEAGTNPFIPQFRRNRQQGQGEAGGQGGPGGSGAPGGRQGQRGQ